MIGPDGSQWRCSGCSRKHWTDSTVDESENMSTLLPPITSQRFPPHEPKTYNHSDDICRQLNALDCFPLHTLHYIKFRVKNAEELQSLYRQFKIYSKRSYGKDAKSKWDFSLVLQVCREFDDVTWTSKLCLRNQRGTLSRWQWTVVLVEHPVPRSMMTAGVVGQESWWLAERCQPGRPVQVHRSTGTPWRRAWRISAAAYETSAGGRAAG